MIVALFDPQIWWLSRQVPENRKIVYDRWSSGVSKRPKKGDRFFLIQLGEEPKGIFASGSIERDAYKDIHWDEDKASLGEITNFVKIKYDILLNPKTDRVLDRKLLNSPALSKMHWDTQMSGVQIPDDIACDLEELWATITNSLNFTFPEEVEETKEEILLEGAIRRISVNAYERNPEARRVCIEYYGAISKVCGFDFEKSYGEIGMGFIHVHHVKQISEIGTTYQVDPVNDLLPVCPNCHAIIHKRKPSFTIDEVKGFLRK